MIATPIILAIDLGKFNSVFYRFDPESFRRGVGRMTETET